MKPHGQFMVEVAPIIMVKISSDAMIKFGLPLSGKSRIFMVNMRKDRETL